MKLLVLGGTVFLGRHVVTQALEAGHEVTLLHRGRHGGGPVPAARTLIGDRDGDLSALTGQAFDAVIDCSGYTAAQIERGTALLADVPRYLFVSSISVVAAFPPGVPHYEDAPLLTGEAGYGEQKARAEAVLLAARAGRATIVRPGLIVGPHDPTGRFTHWPLRVASGGEVLAPGRPERPVQIIDGRDLAAWCLQLVEHGVTGTFNAIGDLLPMSELLDTCREVSASDARFTWIDDRTLVDAKVEAWSELPLWIPEDDPAFGGMLLGRNDRARAAGLQTRPLADTVRETLAWALSSDGQAARSPHAMSAQREAALLAAAATR
ncbi:NAD-dependent epimerase/dehydratase family protein [Rhizobacter sp. AJA081-3]|uniref:NAD-dependent epimerase/dehydratase family protein n=1 Tax=Rhizobacter sp. AJA081-3 TaxID=2753607 RepID=UPI001ADEF21C|nr:NAD-dependent epimerase/dehydratase family protein [Rhizobacter sp. AJA081-3]QTN21726.1 NAD-dependent epimerase/dehydratase family protein [Rhizobacter sp. AJA081-3]